MDTEVVSRRFVEKVARTKKISISELFAELGMTPPAELTTRNIDLVVGTDGWSAHAELENEPQWTIPIGSHALSATFRNLTLDVERKNGQSSATFEGVMDLGRGVTLTMSFEMPGDAAFEGAFGAVKLSQIVAFFPTAIDFPPQFDLEFGKNSARVAREDGIYTLKASTELKNVGEFELKAAREEGQWGLRVEGSVSGDPFKLPGLELLAPLASAARIREPKLVVTTRKEPHLSIQSRVAPEGLLGPFVLLLNYIGVQIDENRPVAVEIYSRADKCRLTIPFVSSKVPLKGVVGVKLEKGQPTVMLDGKLSTSFGEFIVGAMGTVSGVMISGSHADPNAKVSIGIGTLRNLGITLGINSGGIPSFGFFGTFDSSDFEMSVAFFANSVDPSKSMVAASLDSMTLNDVVTTITRVRSFNGDFLLRPLLERIAIRGIRSFDAGSDLANALDAENPEAVAAILRTLGFSIADASEVRVFVNARGSRWHFAHLTASARHYSVKRKGDGVQVDEQGQLYFAPEDTTIGGVKFKQGMRISANLEFLAIKASVEAEIVMNKGIRADVKMDPVVIGGADFIELTSAESRDRGPIMSVATYEDPKVPGDDRYEHIHLSGRLRILGTDFAKATVYGDIRGLYAGFQADLTPFVSVGLAAIVSHRTSALIDGRATVKLPSVKTPIGEIPSPITVSLKINGSAANTLGMTTVQGTFSVFGQGFSLPAMPLAGPLTQLDAFLLGPVTNLIAKELGFNRWMDAVEKGLILPGPTKELAGILFKHFGRTLGQTVSKLYSLGKSGADVVAALRNLTSDPKAALHSLLLFGYTIGDVAVSMKDIFQATPELAVEVTTAIYGGVKKISLEVGRELAKVLQKVWSLDANGLANAFKQAGWAATEVGRFFRNVGYDAGEVAKVLYRNFAWSAEQTADFLKNGMKETKEGVEKALQAAGYAANEVGNAMKKFWDTATSWL